MAAKDGNHPSSSRQPACVKLSGKGGKPGMTINIGRVTKSVSVSQRTTVMHTNATQPQSDHHGSSGHLPHSPHQASHHPQSEPNIPTKYEEQTKTFEEVARDLPNRNLEEGTIGRIARHFDKGWRRVFRHLNFSDVQIDNMFKDSDQQLQETVQKLLVQWCRSSQQADVMTLAEALVRAEQMDIIQYLRD